MKDQINNKIELSDIRSIEKKMLVKFPLQFQSFLLENNGGIPTYRFFYVDGKSFFIHHFFSLEEIIAAWNYTKEIPLIKEEKVFIIAELLGNYELCIGFDEKNSDQIYFIDYHMRQCILLAENLEKFFSKISIA